MRIAYLDCFAGAAGDMCVAACLDAGLELAELERELARLGLGGYELRAERVTRQGIAGTKFEVALDPAMAQPHRHLADLQAIVARAEFAPELGGRMLRAFEILAQAEAEAHGCAVEEVHFHEVGAVDAILDVCGTVLGLSLLGVKRVFASAVEVGSGKVTCEHGIMPVPAPGTLAALRGAPIRRGQCEGERCTPTGAALLRALVDEFEPAIVFRPIAVGYGAGTRDDAPLPNLLRLTLGECDDASGPERVFELQCQVDNVSGEVLGHALRRAIEAGALDAWAVPSITKKNRPAHWVVVLADAARRDMLEELLLSELPTLGLRRQCVERRTLPRRVEERDTPLGTLRFKVRTLPDGSEVAHPEADEVERLARELGLAVPVVLERLHRG